MVSDIKQNNVQSCEDDNNKKEKSNFSRFLTDTKNRFKRIIEKLAEYDNKLKGF